MNDSVANDLPAVEPFLDLDKLRLTQDFASKLGTEKTTLAVPIRKPGRTSWVRVHPDPAYRLDAMILEIKEMNESYMLDRSLWDAWASELTPKSLYTTVDRAQNLGIWAIKLPDELGRLDHWNQSAHEAALRAQDTWIRLVSNRSLGAYEVLTPTAKLPEPVWPDRHYSEILRIAFKDHFIDSADHPVLAQLRGER